MSDLVSQFQGLPKGYQDLDSDVIFTTYSFADQVLWNPAIRNAPLGD